MASPKARGRMIRKSISESARFASLSPEAAVLFVMLIPHFNSHGKMPGGPGIVKDDIVPLIPYFTYDNLPLYLQEISSKTNVKWFRSGNKWWLHSLHFLSEHQDLETGKLGQDLLPDYSLESPGGDSRGLVGDYSETSPRLPLRAEGFKVLRLEENQENQTKPLSLPSASACACEETAVLPVVDEVKGGLEEGKSPSKAEAVFEQCWEENGRKIRAMFPSLDFVVERAKCVAFHRNRSPPIDPLLAVLRWCECAGKAGKQGGAVKRKSSAQEREERILANAREVAGYGG